MPHEVTFDADDMTEAPLSEPAVELGDVEDAAADEVAPDAATASSDDVESRRAARRRLRRGSGRFVRDKECTRELFRRYHEEGDEEARSQIIENYMNYVRYIASKYRDSNEPMADLIQAGYVGLIEAVDRYDPSMKKEFTTFAYSTIDGEIKHYFRDKGWMVRPPRYLQELSTKVRKTRDILTSELNRTPTVAEIAERLEVSVDDVLRAMEASGAYSSVSLEGGSSTDTEDDAPTVLDRYQDEDEDLTSTDDRIVLSQVLSKFSAREQDVFRMRYEEGLKQAQIAERLGISQVQVSRLLHRMTERARELFEGA